MDKNAIKKYAVWARRELIARVSQKALRYGITETEIVDAAVDSVNGQVLSAAEKKQRQALITQIREKGFEQVMEEVAYTWFNRFSALRFMEVNGYLPSHVRVFTDDENNFKPQIITEAIHLELDGLDMEKVYALKEADKTEELFKYLLIVQCNALNSILPGMFQRIEDYTELLLPDNLLREGSVVEQMIAMIPEEDWQDQVQIIGWLYQYYNTEPKDTVFANLKKNIKISKENIPAATQLFTPDWIVRYMVENSLGRLWVERNAGTAKDDYDEYPGDVNEYLLSKWKYYLFDAVQEPEVEAQMDKIRKEYAKLTPGDIKCIDPCCGSGHIIAYIFDVLIQIYEAYGFTTREAVTSIVENNIYGLDIDDRAAQLAYFSVMMKARQYDRRFFSRGIQPHVYAIEESNDINRRQLQYFGYGMSDIEKNSAINQMEGLLDTFTDAKEYGSILNVDTCDWDLLRQFVENIGLDGQMSLDAIGMDVTQEKLKRMIELGRTMAQKYDVVVTNPPYMAITNAERKVFDYVKKKEFVASADLYGVFIEKCNQMLKSFGFQAMITQHSWMYLASFEKLRIRVGQNVLTNMAHLGPRAFDEISGEVVQTTAFVLSKHYVPAYRSKIVRLVDFPSQSAKEMAFLSGNYQIESAQDSYQIVPGIPMVYWLSDKAVKNFERGSSINSMGMFTGQQNITANNDKYLRLFWEVSSQKIGRDAYWIFYTKGGTFRRWYGNIEYVVDWTLPAKKFYSANPNGKLLPEEYCFEEGITYTEICSGANSFRYLPPIGAFDKKGPSIVKVSHLYYNLGFFNSKVASYYFNAINPTISLQIRDVKNTPIVIELEKEPQITSLVKESIYICQADWDSFETSWDFKLHPLLFYAALTPQQVKKEQESGYNPTNGLAYAYRHWEMACEGRFNQLKANEEELNRIFIDIYGLQDELTPEVEDKDVTVRKADLQRDIKSLISYAVGCMFGRYSLDVDGLAYAGGEWDASKYVTFPADKDSIIPICDDEYFADDIVGRFVKFIEVVYGAETLDENLKFLADALGGKGQPKEVIRNYFMNDFYADHCKMYQKRPIYWLFDSGKKNGFKALIYMHRYQPDTIARIRTDYVHEQQARYRTALADLEQRIANASAGERVKLNKKLKQLQEQAAEIHAYEEKIHHLADQMIRIDLDDGVKVNYAKFQDVLAKIK